MKTYNLAVIPGDGIGVDVTDAAMEVLDVAGAKFGFEMAKTSFPWSCEYYLETGAMMPAVIVIIRRLFRH